MKTTRSLLVTMAVALSVSACGGGGGSGASTPAADTGGTGATTPPASTTSATGVWSGKVTSTSTGQSYSMVGLTGASGQSVWMTMDGRVWHGQMPMDSTQFSTTMAGYMYPGSHFPDGSTHGPSTMMFGNANGTWSGQYSGTGDAGTFTVGMSPMWNRPASPSILAGVYTRTTSIGYTMTMSITQDGQLTANDTRGCVINGTVTVPDPSHNLYQLNANVTSCGVLNGTYQGMGTLVDANAMREWMSNMGCFQYGQNGMMGGGMMGGWWPNTGTNTVPSGTQNLLMFSMVNGHYAMMDALAR